MMRRRSNTLQEELVQCAHALASGRRQAQVAKDFGWDTPKMRRCVARITSEVVAEGERRYWSTITGTALEWLRLRDLCTPDELDKAKAMAQQAALEKLEETLVHGERHRYHGQHEEAEQKYLRHLHDDPGNIEVLVALGHCLMEKGRYGEALEYFDSALQGNPAHAIARRGKALTLARTNPWEALRELEEARRLEPDDAATTALLGNWLMRAAPAGVAVCTLNEAIATLVQQCAGRTEKGSDLYKYCCRVVEMVLRGFWENGYSDEAVTVARTAQQHGWNTVYINDVLESRVARYLFRIVVLASSENRPEDWPDSTVGYQQKLVVVAKDADEARAAALESMKTHKPVMPARQAIAADEVRVLNVRALEQAAKDAGEPSSSVHFKIDDIQQEGKEAAVMTTVFFPEGPLWVYQNACGPTTTKPAGVARAPSRGLLHRRAWTRRRR